MTITFLGHSSLYIDKALYEKVEMTIRENIDTEEELLFLCGGYGDFDNMCAKICRCIKKEKPYCHIAYVTPYITESEQKKIRHLLDFKFYDSVIYPPLENVPPRFAISKRNEWMINESNIIVAYVKYTYGGAYKSFKYAERKKKRIINLAKE